MAKTTNLERAARGAHLLESYQDNVVQHTDEVPLPDLLCDLLHLCWIEGWVFDDDLKWARNRFADDIKREQRERD